MNRPSGPIPVHDYKSEMDALFKPNETESATDANRNQKNKKKKQLYDPHGDYMKDAHKGRSKGRGGGRNRSRR